MGPVFTQRGNIGIQQTRGDGTATEDLEKGGGLQAAPFSRSQTLGRKDVPVKTARKGSQGVLERKWWYFKLDNKEEALNIQETQCVPMGTH